MIENTTLVCGAFDDNCIVYTVRYNSKPTETNPGELLFAVATQFRADFCEELPTVNCSSFCNETDKLITGGQDGIVRVWKLTNKKGLWFSKCVNELSGHSGPIMSVQVHSQNAAKWVCSASRDGTVKLWDYSVGAPAVPVKAANPALTPPQKEKSAMLASLVGKESLEAYIGGNGDEAKASGVSLAAPNVSYECRGVEFSPNGHELFVLLCPRKGCATVVRYLLEVGPAKHNKNVPPGKSGGPKLAVQPRVLGVLNVAEFPCTKMRMSSDGSLLAIGSSTGSTAVVRVCAATSERKASIRVLAATTELHDLPVTGLGFIRSNEEGGRQLVVSCSADNKSITTVLGSGDGDMSMLLLLAVVILMIALILYYLQEQGLITLPEF